MVLRAGRGSMHTLLQQADPGLRCSGSKPFIECCQCGSYGDDEEVKSLLRHGQSVFLESGDITPNRLSDVLSCFLLRLTLADASGEARAFTNPSRLRPDKLPLASFLTSRREV